MSAKSLSEIKQLFEKLFPEQTPRLRCLSLFAESITYAHHHAPDEWVVRLHPHTNRSEIRLIVGGLISIQVWRGKVWIALDAKELEATPQSVLFLNKAQSWQWDAENHSVFKHIPSRSGYYFPDKSPLEELWPVVRELNFSFVKRIGKSKRKLRPWSRAAYQPAVLEFLRQELKQSIPEPRTDLALPEEISEGKVFYEGTRKQISVNAYERSPIARRVCLEHYGTRCTACAQDMSETYGAVAAGLIHIHHLKPLSELQEGYEVNPIEDLCPVCPICPNCHAVIHRSTPPYTIEEVKDFLEKHRKDKKELP